MSTVYASVMTFMLNNNICFAFKNGFLFISYHYNIYLIFLNTGISFAP